MKVLFLSRLSVTEVAEGLWSLDKPFYAIVEHKDGSRVEVIIPENFITDFCSVPRIPIAWLLYGGIGNRAGVLHDALYSAWKRIIVRNMETNTAYEVTRSWADDVLSAALVSCTVPAYKRGPMWAGVRVAGWRFFKKNPLNPDPIEPVIPQAS
jgi:hypothetical protein